MANNDPNNDQGLDDMYGSRDSNSNIMGNTIKNSRKAAQKARAAKKALQTGAKAGKRIATRAISKVILAALPYILMAVAAIGILLLLIALIAFIFSGPDMLRGQIVKMADEFWTAAKAALVDVTKGPDYAEATEGHVTDVGGYIENMGYKLEGWGFIDESAGDKVERNDKDIVTSVKSTAITEYIAAEARTYMLSTISLSSLFRYLSGVLGSSTTNTQTTTTSSSIAQNSEVRTGMINISSKVSPVRLEINNNEIYDDKSNTLVNGVEKITPEIDRAGRKLILKIKQGKYVVNPDTQKKEKKEFETTCIYNLDGWVGRYGKPIEFLLALHLGTMAPEFAKSIAMGKEFDTRVNIKIHKSMEVYKLTWRGETVEEALKKFEKLYKEKYNDCIRKNEEAKQSKASSRYGAYMQVQIPYPNPEKTAEEYAESKMGCTRKELQQAIAYQEEKTQEKYTPYIVRVKNHWYRDLVFKEYLEVASDKDAYVQGKPSKRSGGLYLSKFQIDIYTSGDIYQVKEPRLGPVNEKLEDLINNHTWTKITGIEGQTTTGKIEFKDEMANAVVMLDKAAQKSDDAKFISRDLKEWLAMHDFKFTDSHILSYNEEKEIEINKDNAKSPESEEEEFIIDISNLNTSNKPTSSGGGGGSFTPTTGKIVAGSEQSIIKAMDYLINEQGFTVEAAAGVCGNIAAESSWNPRADNGQGYYGIFQWNSRDRWQDIKAWLDGQGLEVYDTMNQLKSAFNSEDYTHEKARGSIDAVKNLTNVEQAAYAWGDEWERCHEYVDGKPTDRLQGEQERKEYARGAYEVYQNYKKSNNSGAATVAKITTTNESTAISKTLGTDKTAQIVYKGSRATYKTAEMENDIDVNSLLSGTVEKISDETIQIKGSTEKYDGITIILTGADINEDLKVGDTVLANQQIAKTITGKDVRIQFQDEDKKIVSLERALNL